MAPKNNVRKCFTKINKTEVKAHFKPKNTNIKKTDMLSQETLFSPQHQKDQKINKFDNFIYLFCKYGF